MSQLLVSCPLCCQATFSSTDTLCVALVTVASKRLKCPLCEEVLCGLDKLTIHLLSHLLIQPSDQITNHVKDTPMKQKELRENRNGIAGNLKVIDEQHNQLSISDVENVSNVMSIDGRQKIVVDDEVMLVIGKDKKQKERPQECISRDFTQMSDSAETLLKQITLNDTCHEMPALALLNNPNSVESNCNTEIYYKTGHIPENSNTRLSSESNNGNPNDYCIKNKKSHTGLDHIVSKNGGVFIETNALNQLHFRSCVEVLDYSLKLADNLPDSMAVQKPKMKFRSLEADSSAQTINTSYHDGLCSGPINNTTCTSSSSLGGLECGKCPVTFVDPKMLTMHHELAHSVEVPEEKKKTYSCKLCTKSFKMRGSLVVHTKVAHSSGPTALTKLLEASKRNEAPSFSNDITSFTCSVCGKGFKKEQHLVQHEKTHEGKQWECDVCTKTFTTKYFLKKHHLLHTGEMPYTCTTCNKSFTFQQSYHKHLLYHSDDKPYQCNECGRSFKELSTLHNHQRIHTGEKPYSCETCGKCFRQRVSYLVHRRIHTGDMPYKCPDCNRRFRYKVSERTHKCRGNFSLMQGDDSESLLVSPKETTNEIAEENGLPTSRQDNSVCSELVGSGRDWLEPSCSISNKGGSALVNNNYAEPTDFFSLIMSPSSQYTSDKLENLRLSPDDSMKWDIQKNSLSNNDDKLKTDLIENVTQDSLKELLYNVGDYH